MRIIFALVSGVLISVGLFFGMHLMISSDNKTIKDDKKIPHLVYLRDKTETKVEKKKRVKPKEPPKKEPVKQIKIIKTSVPKVNQKVKVKPLKTVVPRNLDISAISSLSGAQVAAGKPTFYDANTLQTLKKVHPKFPRRAKLKKQSGYVKLSLVIDEQGNVVNVEVLESEPKGVFEKASIKAMKKWKFKPKGEKIYATIVHTFRRTE